jgi:hypothetical protein
MLLDNHSPEIVGAWEALAESVGVTAVNTNVSLYVWSAMVWAANL